MTVVCDDYYIFSQRYNRPIIYFELFLELLVTRKSLPKRLPICLLLVRGESVELLLRLLSEETARTREDVGEGGSGSGVGSEVGEGGSGSGVGSGGDDGCGSETGGSGTGGSGTGGIRSGDESNSDAGKSGNDVEDGRRSFRLLCSLSECIRSLTRLLAAANSRGSAEKEITVDST